MSGTWWTRFLIILGVMAWAAYTLAPSVLGESAAERNAAMVADATGGDGADPEGPQEWYWSYLPDARISLGLDLQGGIELNLDVGVDEAVVSSVQRDIKPLKDAATEAGLNLPDIRRERGEPVMLIATGSGTGLNDLTVFMQEKYQTYVYDSTRDLDETTYHAWRVTDEEADFIAERSVKQALETLRNRIDETGVKEPAIVLKGGNRINVQLPGMDNVQQAVDAIGTTAVLEFMMVDEDTMKDRGSLERGLIEARDALEEDEFHDDDVLSDWMVRNDKLASGMRLMWSTWRRRTARPALTQSTWSSGTRSSSPVTTSTTRMSRSTRPRTSRRSVSSSSRAARGCSTRSPRKTWAGGSPSCWMTRCAPHRPSGNGFRAAQPASAWARRM